MPRGRVFARRPAAFLALLLWSGAALAQDRPVLPERTFRAELANDVVFESDNLFTDGFNLQWHSRGTARWAAGDNAFVRAGRWIPGLGGEGQGEALVHRHAFVLGQHTQTPQDERLTTLARDDVPYAGALVAINAWSVYDDTRFRSAELLLGVLGPASGAGWVHEQGHKLIDNRVAQGWTNQLGNRAAFGVGYSGKRKFARVATGGWQADASVDVRATLGNMYTTAGANLALRAGRNLPGGFAYSPGKLGMELVHDARLPPPQPSAWSMYLSLRVGGNAVLRNVFIDDNALRQQLTIAKQPWVGRAALGVHLERGPVSAQFTLAATTDQVKDATTSNRDNNDRYGVLSIALRY